MTDEAKAEAILFRIELLRSKILNIESIYEENPYNNYLLDVKKEFNDSIFLLEKELEKTVTNSNTPINIDIIKNRVRVLNKDPFLDFKINNAMHKFTGGVVFDENLPRQTVVPENERFPVVE